MPRSSTGRMSVSQVCELLTCNCPGKPPPNWDRAGRSAPGPQDVLLWPAFHWEFPEFRPCHMPGTWHLGTWHVRFWTKNPKVPRCQDKPRLARRLPWRRCHPPPLTDRKRKNAHAPCGPGRPDGPRSMPTIVLWLPESLCGHPHYWPENPDRHVSRATYIAPTAPRTAFSGPPTQNATTPRRPEVAVWILRTKTPSPATPWGLLRQSRWPPGPRQSGDIIRNPGLQ
jgi:hypothetical protein